MFTYSLSSLTLEFVEQSDGNEDKTRLWLVGCVSVLKENVLKIKLLKKELMLVQTSFVLNINSIVLGT